MRVAIIGAGPGGLTTLKHLLEANDRFNVDLIEARLFEAEDGIGGTFRYRTYAEGEMVSSRQLTTFGDFRIPDGTPGYGDFLQIPQYIQYLEDYADYFKLRPHIYLNTRVVRLRRQHRESGHIVTYQSQDGSRSDWECDAVAICAGLHVNEGVPKIPGIERVPETFHSSKYKSREQFGQGKNVVILGAGETAMDLAMFAVHSPVKSVTICHRRGFVIAPKKTPYVNSFGEDLSGPPLPPIDTIWSSLFDGAYAHPRLRNSRWQWEFYDKWNKLAWFLFDGTTYGFGQHAGVIQNINLKEEIFVKNQRVSVFFNPLYDQPNVLKSYKRRVVDLIRENKTGKSIDVAPWPTHVDANGTMHFTKNSSIESKYAVPLKPDLVIYATGYVHHSFPFLDPASSYPESRDCNVRSIWRSDDPSIAYIGFVRPQLGAIPPLTEFQAQLWILEILGLLPRELDPDINWYAMQPRPEARIQHGVDHESYAYQLALDIGSAPGIMQVLRRGWRVFAVWALGSNYNTNFRLEGPWKWDGAEAVMETELWNLIPRRDVMWGYIMLNALPIFVFGGLSLMYLLLDVFWFPWNVFLRVVELVKEAGGANDYKLAGRGRTGNHKGRNGMINGDVKEAKGNGKVELVECW